MRWARVYRRAGDVVGPLRIGPDRAGALLVSGPSRDEALASAADAASRIRFDTVDG